MSKKDEFVALAKTYGLEDLGIEGGWKTISVGAFTKVLNEHSDLRKLFREAVAEAEEEKNNPAAGLANLFGVT